MKVIGIAIDKAKAVFYVLEQNDNDKLINITRDFRFLTLKNDTDNSSVRNFQSTIFSFFDDIQPDRIAILTRQTKGRFKSAPLSFKIEGLIQCYEEIDIEFVSPHKILSYFKKNEFILDLEHEYQEKAARLAYYLISQSEIIDF